MGPYAAQFFLSKDIAAAKAPGKVPPRNGGFISMKLSFTLNGKPVALDEVPGEISLLELLRGRLGLSGTKEGCGVGECGACSVLIDGKVVNSCLTGAWQVLDREVTTIEGIAPDEGLHPIQEAFVESGAVQCGFCTPGMVMTVHDLLSENPNPDDKQIKIALAGNLCRCTGYHDVVAAVNKAARKLEGEKP
jgi:aerobic-type carbon monoxide dehydrogenase small subunit (CoxS/CutS family)